VAHPLEESAAGLPVPAPAGRAAAVRELDTGGFTGLIAAGFELLDLERELARLVDPGAALKTLHWGRNYLYLTRCETAAGPVDVVVKQFRNGGLRDRLRRRWGGSKAVRSWRIAQAMAAAGIATPEPLLLLESRCPHGPSFYVCRYLAGRVEARHLLRAGNEGREAELYPGVDLPRFLSQLGAFIRRLHDAGFWHRDLSSGNVLARPEEPFELALVDLNRARRAGRLTLSQRARDLSRMNLLRREHRRLLLAGYWAPEGGEGGEGGEEGEGGHGSESGEGGAAGARGGPPLLGRALYGFYFRAFLWKNQWKKWLRRGRPAGGRPSLVARVAHAHIPDAPAGAPVRDKIVWDHLSDQPHQHAGRLSKLRVRLADASIHATTAVTVARAVPRIWRRFRELPRELYGGAVPWGGAGVCLRPWPEAPEALLALVEQLGTPHLLLRLHPWQEDHRAEEELAAELSRRGYDLTFALPQNRELVRDPARWRASLASLGERFSPYGRRFQVGQAINRSKWGVWNLREYAELARGAEEVLRRLPGVELLGPSVIDFEYHLAIAALNLPNAGFHFDAVSGLLYVDRCGPPEGRQVGFDTVDKVRLLRAIADTGINCCWGPRQEEEKHEPTGRAAGPGGVSGSDGAGGPTGAAGPDGTGGPTGAAGPRHAGGPTGRGRCWITEMNWPLWEGPHSPAGRDVSVDEETQADYLARYYLLALGTGLVERVFWWQLVARGYGLVDPGGAPRGRCRPSFHALRTLLAELEGSRLEEVLPAPPPARLFRYRRPDGGDLVAAWSPVRRRGRLPRPAVRVVGRDGSELPPPPGVEVELLPAPAYFHLVSD
jgi:tRNA A-37 threonylcarbamoyl transferase component Bud32